MLQVLSGAQDQISKQRIRGVTLSCFFLLLAFEWHKAVCFSERRLTVKGGKTLSTLSASIPAAIRNRFCWINTALETSEMISSDASVKDVANICIFVISLLTICVRGVTNLLLWEQLCLCHHCLRSNGH